MRNPFRSVPALTCGRCSGLGRVKCYKAELGKGWKPSGITCPDCQGHGTLRRR